jgi:hypothetical protein
MVKDTYLHKLLMKRKTKKYSSPYETKANCFLMVNNMGTTYIMS